MFLTIFTPIYNRSKYVSRLFSTLDNQKVKNFEWIIINDGSTDDTENKIKEDLKKSHDFPINYMKVPNGGKQRAINLAAKIANGKYFFILDSDDYLLTTTTLTLEKWCKEIEKEPDYNRFAAVSGLRKKENTNEYLGTCLSCKYLDATSLERDKYHLYGDMAECYKTNILRKYPFKVFNHEKFVTEETVWNRIAADGYKIRWYMKPIYVGEYHSDGLTKNEIVRDIKNYQGLIYATKQAVKLKEFRSKAHNIIYYAKVSHAKGLSYKKAAKKISYPYIEFILLVYCKKVKDYIKNIKE